MEHMNEVMELLDNIINCCESISKLGRIARAINPGIAENDGNESMAYPFALTNYAYRHFDAGEKVSIFHTGKTGQNAAKTIAIVVWDGIFAGQPEDDPQTEPEQKEEEIEEAEQVINLVFDKNVDTTSNIWKDNSGYQEK